jgi:hypothetical protein
MVSYNYIKHKDLNLLYNRRFSVSIPESLWSLAAELIQPAHMPKVAWDRGTEGHGRNWFVRGSRASTFVTEPGRSSVDSAGVGLLKFIQLSYSLSRFFSSDPDQAAPRDFSHKGL